MYREVDIDHYKISRYRESHLRRLYREVYLKAGLESWTEFFWYIWKFKKELWWEVETQSPEHS